MIRTERIDKHEDWTFCIEVIRVTDASTPLTGRLDYAPSCILCDEEIGNFDSMGEAECAGHQHECSDG